MFCSLFEFDTNKILMPWTTWLVEGKILSFWHPRNSESDLLEEMIL